MKLPHREDWRRAGKYIESVSVQSLSNGYLAVKPRFTPAGQNEEGECGLGFPDRLALADMVEELVNAALKGRHCPEGEEKDHDVAD